MVVGKYILSLQILTNTRERQDIDTSQVGLCGSALDVLLRQDLCCLGSDRLSSQLARIAGNAQASSSLSPFSTHAIIILPLACEILHT